MKKSSAIVGFCVAFTAMFCFSVSGAESPADVQNDASKKVIAPHSRDIAHQINTATSAHQLKLEQIGNRVVRVTCPAKNNEGFDILVPEGIVVGLANQNRGLVFSLKGEKFLLLVNTKFADTNEYSWMVGSASYNKNTKEWTQVGALIAEKNLTIKQIEEVLEKQLK